MSVGRLRLSGLAIAVLSAALLTLSMGVPFVAAKNGGNSANAKMCQQNGWMTLQRADGTLFASEEDCTSYAAQGGTVQPQPPFEVTCHTYGGTYQTDPFLAPGFNVYLSPTCTWTSQVNPDSFDSALDHLEGYCFSASEDEYGANIGIYYIGCGPA